MARGDVAQCADCERRRHVVIRALIAAQEADGRRPEYAESRREFALTHAAMLTDRRGRWCDCPPADIVVSPVDWRQRRPSSPMARRLLRVAVVLEDLAEWSTDL